MHQKRLLDGLNVLEGIALYSEVLVQHIGGGGTVQREGRTGVEALYRDSPPLDRIDPESQH